jgi:hypothetical protein
LKISGPPQAENFGDLGGCFMQKMLPDCTQEREKRIQNAKKFRLRRAYYRNPLSNAPSVIFAPAANQNNSVF